MEFLYNIVINAVEKLLPFGNKLGDKMKLFSEGRKDVFSKLMQEIQPDDRTIWIHTASLGEFEQAVPVMERLKKEMPQHKIIVSFFSPSGYEIKKENSLADVVTYLPLDTKANAARFLNLVHPEWAVFVKYEFWPNFLQELGNRGIKTLLVSGSFREDQLFFKPYGKWMQKYLQNFNHFFVQNERSTRLLEVMGFQNATVSGDTRFDRVSQQIEQNNNLDFIEEFKDNRLTLVAGSTWPEDELLLLDFIKKQNEIKVIIAPHTLKPQRIQKLKEYFGETATLYSQKEGNQLSNYKILIIDTIGLLTKIYSYADIAYVGGAAGNTGLHNILEPATFGVPVVIGTNYDKFPEAKQLRKLAGLYSVNSPEEASAILNKLTEDNSFRQKTGLIAEHFVQSNVGATEIILRYFHNNS